MLSVVGPAVVAQGERDAVCPATLARDVLAGLPVSIRTRPGDHQLPLRDPAFSVELVANALHEVSGSVASTA